MTRETKLEVIESKTGNAVPVVNGAYLHSEFDPVKEAKKFATNFIPLIKRNNRLLIMGLGFGYHIDEIIKLMITHHGSNIKIAVIEPNRALTVEFLRHRSLNKGIVQIFCKDNVEELFSSKELINFIAQDHAIIKHTQSYNLTQKFYDEIINYNAFQDLKRSRVHLKNFNVRREIAKFPQELTLKEIHQKNVKANERWMDHLLKAFSNIAYKQGEL